MAPYDPRHYRFVRQYSDSPVLECYEPQPKFRWGVCIAVGAVVLLALVV